MSPQAERNSKLDEPTAEELGLPSDTHALYAYEATLAAPRAAWRAYWASMDALTGERNVREEARRKASQLRGERRGFGARRIIRR